MSDGAGSGVLDRLERLRAHRARWVQPREDSLPNWRVLWVFPILVVLVFGVLVAAGVTGSSSGYYYSSIARGSDPALLAGEPRAIRSDEWNIGTPLTIGQVQQGLPETNRSLPGGQDAAIPMDLPRRDWSVSFRPQHLGYLVLPLDNAAAWWWWIPLIALLIAAYQFVVSVLPRRPELAALAAVGLGSAPFFQWWFETVSFWPVAWGLTVMTAILWAFRSRRRAARWGWAAAAGYLTVVMAMGIYVPYIIPVAVVVAFFVVGAVIGRVRDGFALRSTLVRVVPLVIAGAVGAAITAAWLLQEHAAVSAFLGTSYPGNRSVPSGSGGPLLVARTLASSFSEALVNHNGFLGLNSSEASTFFFFGAFVLPAALVAGFALRRRIGGRAPWELIALAAGALLLVAYALVPGWDTLAHLLFLDRTTDVRLRIGLGFASFAMIPFAVQAINRVGPVRAVRITGFAAAGVFLLSQLGIAAAVAIQFGASGLAQQAPFWWAYALASTASLVLFTLNRTTLAITLVAAVGLVGAAGVNPLYVGLLDLRPTQVARATVALDPHRDRQWVAVGSGLPTAILIEEGMHTYSGTQGAPSRVMWKTIDPHHRYTYEWNRLATVRWEFGTGAPVIDNPAPDVIRVTLDPCSAFAQSHLEYVLTDLSPPESACLQAISTYTLNRSTIHILAVVPRP